MKTIDITPTWASIIPPLLEVLKNPKAPAQAKKEVTAELVRLAKIVDDQNIRARQLKELTSDS
tara:strand:+ start:116 stop:304 length:189 start_codon:yes stop_codon:yes gene_type:complete